MARTKTRKDYRFSAQTLRRLDWLTRRAEKNSTEILETAVERLFEEEWSKARSRLIPRPDSLYDFVVGGVTLLTIDDRAFPKLGGYLSELLSPEGSSNELFGLVLFLACYEKGKVAVYDENVQWFFDPLHDQIEQVMAETE